jgi:hypothetical protein
MKVILLHKMAGAAGFFPVGSIVDLPEPHAQILVANRAAQTIGLDGKPIPLPKVEVKVGGK